MMRKIANKLTPLIIFFALAVSASVQAADIKILFLYGPWMNDWWEGGDPLVSIDEFVTITNDAFEFSNVDIRITEYSTVEIDWDNSLRTTTQVDMLASMQDPSLPDLPFSSENNVDLEDLIIQYKADFVSVVHNSPAGEEHCGRGVVDRGQADFVPYTVVAVTFCGHGIFAHELGHNFGLMHSYVQTEEWGETPGYESWARGHGIEWSLFNPSFVTNMAYPEAYDACAGDNFCLFRPQELHVWSNPNVECVPDEPCGVPVDEEKEADAAKLLNDRKYVYSNYYPDDPAPTPTPVPGEPIEDLEGLLTIINFILSGDN